MNGGELIVSGKDHVEIKLSERPEKVIVRFEGEEVIVPCNPHHHDELTWHLTKDHNHHHHYSSRHILTIRWIVTGVRKIVWKVTY